MAGAIVIPDSLGWWLVVATAAVGIVLIWWMFRQML